MMLWLLILMGAVFGAAIVGEIYARFVRGLGDPPLWRSDEQYEYVLKPNQQCRRFGNTILVNRFSMRSRDNSATKSDPNELRVLVLGDSIVNGGPRIGHNKLATTMLERKLSDQRNQPVWVGNISAGSWGPPNLLAFVRRHGLYDANVIVVVVNSADYFKELLFRPLDPGRPSHRPLLALQEVFGNYVRRRVRRKLRTKIREANQAARTGAESDAAMRELLNVLRDGGAHVVVLQHLARHEISDKPDPGFAELRAIAQQCGIEPVSLGPVFAEAVHRGNDPYQDGLHPNQLGQEILARILFEHVSDAFETRTRPDS